MPQRVAVMAMWSPIDSPVRGSVLAGTWMPRSVGRNASAAIALSVELFARFIRSSLRRSFSGTTTGASEAESAPPAMPDSICPSAILFATRIAASRPVPQAWVMS